MPELISEWSCDNARVVTSDKHREKALRVLDNKRVFVDTETDGIERFRKLKLLQIGDKNNTWLIDPNTSFIREVLPRLFKSSITWIAYNAPFDMLTLGLVYFKVSLLDQSNIEKVYSWMTKKALANQVIDPMVAEQIITSNPRYTPMSALAAKEGVDNAPEREWIRVAEAAGMSPSNRYAASANNPAWLRYAAHDITQLRAVYRRVKPHLSNQLIASETAVNVFYETLKHRGMCINFGGAADLYHALSVDKTKTMNKLAEYGIHNANSNRQVGEALEKAGYRVKEYTSTGLPQVTKHTLANINKPKKAKRIAKHVAHAKSLTKDMGSVANLAKNSPDGCRVYPSLWRIGTITGRSSCETPNLQQLNKHQGDSRVRSLLGADWTATSTDRLATVDFNGMELRVIAAISGDKKLTRALLNDDDIHGEVAGMIYGPDYSEKQRYKAKIGVFAMLYGAGSKAIASQTGATIDEADALKAAWIELYPTVAKASRKWTKEAGELGYTTLPNGWTIPTYDAPYRAVNYQIQGMAAFVFRESVIQAARAGVWRYVRMVVHDEFVLSLPNKGTKRILKQFEKAVTVRHTNMIYSVKGELYGQYWGHN